MKPTLARPPLLALWLAAMLAPALSAAARGGDSAPAPSKPADASMVELGKQYFDRACTYCHGKEGDGGKTPSFKGRKDFTAEYLSETIANGRVKGANIMPAWKGSLSEAQISQLVAYIMYLAKQPASPS